MSSIYLPLRSNANWFRSHSTVDALERRLKSLLCVYDEIILQDGACFITVWQDGQSLVVHIPPGHRPPQLPVRPDDQPQFEGPRLRIAPEGERPGLNFGGGPVEFDAFVDFGALVQRAGIASVEGVRVEYGHLSKKAQSSAEDRAQKDLRERSAEVCALLSTENATLRKTALQSLYIDLTIGLATKRTIAVDPVFARMLAWGTQSFFSGHADPRAVAHRCAVSIGVPDFGAEDWDAVLRIRESAAGRDYRAMLDRVACEAFECLAGGATLDEVAVASQAGLLNELVIELLRRRTNPAAQSLEFGLNLLLDAAAPGVSLAREVQKALIERQSWVSLIRPRLDRPA